MPIITKIEPSTRNPLRVFMVCDGSSYPININAIAKFACYEDKEISDEELEEILTESLHDDLQERVINYISYSPRTEFQIRGYIKKYLYKIGILELDINFEEIIEKIITKLKEYNYVNDESFAELFVKSRLQNKPRSRFFLLSELLGKGIEKELANKVLDNLLPESFEILQRVYEKKYGDEILTFEDKKKISYLQRKGFLWDDISKLVNFFEGNNNGMWYKVGCKKGF